MVNKEKKENFDRELLCSAYKTFERELKSSKPDQKL